MHVRVAQAYLKADDDVAADRAVKRAGEYVVKTSSWSITAQYKACYASVLDAKRKFLDAALRYAELATSEEAIANVQQDELMSFLQKAAICAVLAPAGPQRSRFMAGLYRDERTINIDVSME
jgi:COP9 signalosome complex subunit 4